MRILYVTLLVVVVDQVSKLLVKGFWIPSLNMYHAGMQLGESIPLIGNFFRLTFIENPGMAFGIDLGGKIFLTGFSFLASLGILYYLFKIRREGVGIRFSLAMILGGAIGNLIDRIFYGLLFGEGALFYGKVVDFFDVDFVHINLFGYQLNRFPIFNVADSCVTIGVLLMLFFHREFSGDEQLHKSGEAQPVGNGAASDLHPSGEPHS
ncbi:MAG: signal peptidase II [Ignavibacteriales bacterium]|nr:signal peptidase II [Ignavibacteriales bacterium]